MVQVATPFATGGEGASNPQTLSTQISCEGPPGARLVRAGVLSLRHAARVVSDSLVGIEVNPGPGRVRRGRQGIGIGVARQSSRRGRARRIRRGGGVDHRRGRARRGRRGVGLDRRRDRTRKRHERRKERRREKNERAEGNGRNGRSVRHERRIVTWNLQNVSMREENRRRLKRVGERAEREGWEIVLIQEISATGDGIVWLGEGENRVAIVHSVRAGIILRGSSLDRWIREGQKK